MFRCSTLLFASRLQCRHWFYVSRSSSHGHDIIGYDAHGTRQYIIVLDKVFHPSLPANVVSCQRVR